MRGLLAFATASGSIATGAIAQDIDPLANLDFRSIGPSTMSGRLVDLEVLDVDPNVFYVASSTGGLYKTVNRGVTFESLTDDLPTELFHRLFQACCFCITHRKNKGGVMLRLKSKQLLVITVKKDRGIEENTVGMTMRLIEDVLFPANTGGK